MKHNYTLAKERELKLVDCLNGNLNNDKFNQIADYVKNNLGYKFNSFTHSGSIQTEPGDILGYVSNEIIPLEFKIDVIESHGGGGKNIFKMLNPEILGFGEFEDKVKAPQQRWEVINKILSVNISSYNEQDNIEKEIKNNKILVNGRKGELARITTEAVHQYNDYLILILKTIPEDILLGICNAIFLGYRKNLSKLVNLKTNLIEIQVSNFDKDNIKITHKIFIPKTHIKNITKKGKSLLIEFNSGYIKFPWTHGNKYQGSGKTLSCKYMFKY